MQIREYKNVRLKLDSLFDEDSRWVCNHLCALEVILWLLFQFLIEDLSY